MSLPKINQVATGILEAIEEAKLEPKVLNWPILLLIDGVWVRGCLDLDVPTQDTELLGIVDGEILTSPPQHFDFLSVNLFDVKAYARQTGEFGEGGESERA
jgi:hypothetical protein